MSLPVFDIEGARIAVAVLQQVLAARTHQKKYLDKVYKIPGQLGEALQLPDISSRLNSRVAARRQGGLESFQAVWSTLSAETQQAVLVHMGWYEPDRLEWEDKRSNRKPMLKPSQP